MSTQTVAHELCLKVEREGILSLTAREARIWRRSALIAMSHGRYGQKAQSSLITILLRVETRNKISQIWGPHFAAIKHWQGLYAAK